MTVKEMLKTLEQKVKDGELTHGKRVDDFTYICMTEKLPNGAVVYHQMPYEVMPPPLQLALKGREKGFELGPFKVLSVWDTWEKPLSLPPIKRKTWH